MRTPNLNALKMFDAAARHLNFRLAADELHLTQGAVAQQVRRLEADLGHKLFERKPRGLALTSKGRQYHEPVRRALGIITEATRKLRPESTRVTLSVTPSVASKWLVPRLGRLAQAHPDIDVQVVASEGLADFRSDGVDIAIRLGKPPFGDSLECMLLAPLELCAVCGADTPHAAENVSGVADLVDHPLLQDSHNHWDRLLEREGVVPRKRVTQFNQTALAIDAAAGGQGVALAPRLLVAKDIERGRLAELWCDKEDGHFGFYIVYPKLKLATPARDAVVTWIFSEASH